MSDIDDEAVDWLMRHSSGELGKEERAEFEAWCMADRRHRGAYARALAIQRSLDQLTVQDELKPAAAQRESGWDTAGRGTRNRRAFLLSGALAAGVAAFAVASFNRKQSTERIVIETAKGEFRKVPLADRSVATISSASRLEVDFMQAERRIMLTRGEAWFEVAKDKAKPFIVEAGGVRVRAVGTAFAVRRQSGGAQVLVTEGVVEVWTDVARGRKARLTAGAGAFVADQASDIEVTLDPAEIERKLAWREGKVILNNEPLGEAVNEFNRYNVRQLVVADPALLATPLVGKYRIDQPENFANDLRTLLNVPVVVAGDLIRIGKAPPVGRRPAA